MQSIIFIKKAITTDTEDNFKKLDNPPFVVGFKYTYPDVIENGIRTYENNSGSVIGNWKEDGIVMPFETEVEANAVVKFLTEIKNTQEK